MVVCRLRGVQVKPKSCDKTVTILDEPSNIEIPFKTWLDRGYVVADGIHQKLLSKKKRGDLEIFTVEKDFLTQKKSYVVKRGETFSHGDTLKEAISNLKYKMSSRDTSKFKKWSKNKSVTLEQAIDAYRTITGACEFGVKRFVESITVPKKLTIKKVIDLTHGQYGYKKFAEFFGGLK